MASKAYTLLLGYLYAIHLSFRTNLRLGLCDGAQHVEKQPSGGIASVDVLVQNLQIDSLALQVICNLEEMECGSRQTV